MYFNYKKETSSIDDVLDTFKSAISQKTSFDSIHFIIEKGASIKIGSLMNSIKKIDCNVKWFVKQLVHDDFSYKHGIDEIVEKLKSVFLPYSFVALRYLKILFIA